MRNKSARDPFLSTGEKALSRTRCNWGHWGFLSPEDKNLVPLITMHYLIYMKLYF